MSTRATRLPAKFAETTAKLRRVHDGLSPQRFILPYPVTSNKRLMPVNGRNILSSEYRKWVNLATQELMLQRPRLTKGRVGIYVELRAPDKRRRDLDNVSFKGIIDLLVKCGVIEADDSRFVRVNHSEWVDEGPPCVVTVKPRLD